MSAVSIPKFMTVITSKHRDRLCAGFTGLMLTLSFPSVDAWWLAWVSLVPLFVTLTGKTRREAFILGLIAGCTHYFTLVYWIIVVLEHYGGLPWAASIGVLILLCLYLALYPAVFALLARELRGRRFEILGAAALWVCLEFVRANALTGFPWCLLGHSQYTRLTLIQISDLTGVYGISFLIVAINAALFLLLVDLRSFSGFTRMAETAALVCMVLAALVYGDVRLKESGRIEASQRRIRVAVVQGNIDQSVKWNPQFQRKTVQIYEGLTHDAAGFHPDLVLWPETAVPFFFQEQNDLSSSVIEITRDLRTTLIFGSPAYRLKGERPRYYNRAYMVSDPGKISGYYDKIHLVPFGEYVPLKSLLFFVNRLVPAAGDFESGELLAPLSAKGFSAGALICFEVLFPELSRGQVKKGADILISLTNDAWFGKTSAPYQHLCMAAFRAVENRRPMVRAANTGISSFISATGAIVQKSDLFRRELLKGEVILGVQSQTFYTRHGDLFAWILVGLCSIQFLLIVCYRRISRERGGRK